MKHRLVQIFYGLTLLLLVSVSLTGCGTTKIVDSSKTELHDRSQIDLVQTHEVQENTVTNTTKHLDENEVKTVETVITEYDTGKPVDTATGKPPVLRETTMRETTGVTKQGQEQTETHSNSSEAYKTVDKTKKDIEATTVTKHEETPKTPAIAYVWYILITLIILAALVFVSIYFKWLPKIWKIFKTIIS
jgi:cobalamin biosynthesis Mg chelatase CobN